MNEQLVYVVAAILGPTILFALVRRRRRRKAAARKDAPILVFAARAGEGAPLITPLPRAASAQSTMMPEPQALPREAAPDVRAYSPPPAPGHGRGRGEHRLSSARDGGSFPPASREAPAAAYTRQGGPAPRFEPREAEVLGHDPGDNGTLQLLPGRITVVSGEGVGHEIRFVRVPGTPPEVTFGRSSGPTHRHVQIESPTVSRLHARLRFDGSGWILSNLSRTNPTRLNGRALAGERSEHPVRNGDRIEMGEVTLEFHQPETQDRLPFRSSWASEIGLRSTNQDAVAVRSIPGRREVAVVCDGVGSHQAGARASHTALEALVRHLSAGEELATGFQAANEAVRREAQAEQAGKGMGTTMVAVLREEDLYWVGNVGDSRAYRIDASGIRQITRDHSFIAEAVRAGEMSHDEAARSPWRNAITRNLGAEEQVEVDVFGEFSATEPHVVLLCTDGLHGVLSAEDVERTVRDTGDIKEVARALCDEAIRRGGKDNVSVAALAFAGGLAGQNQ
jgi:protein phosphatase